MTMGCYCKKTRQRPKKEENKKTKEPENGKG